MSIVVEDGTGLTLANSYVSVADCDAYHTLRMNAGWNDIPASPDPTATKEAYLVKATEYLDVVYGERLKGWRTSGTQALYWPRACVIVDGYELDSEDLPIALVRATCEAALLLANGEDLAPTLERGGRIKALTQVVGPLSERTAFADDATPFNVYPAVERYMKALLATSGIMGLAVRG